MTKERCREIFITLSKMDSSLDAIGKLVADLEGQGDMFYEFVDDNSKAETCCEVYNDYINDVKQLSKDARDIVTYGMDLICDELGMDNLTTKE